MDRWEQIARLLGMAEPQYEGPGPVRAPVMPTPERYPGQAGVPQAPMPRTMQAPSWRPLPAPIQRTEQGEPIRGWRGSPEAGWTLEALPSAPAPLRVRPGDDSPRGHGDFASWHNSRLPPEIAPEPPPWSRTGVDGAGGVLSPFRTEPASAPYAPVQADDLDEAWNAAARRVQERQALKGPSKEALARRNR